MAKKADGPNPDLDALQTKLDQVMGLLNQTNRSGIAIIDTLVQRGAFKGEELSTIGAFRDQCLQGVNLCESHQADLAAQA